MQSVGRARWDCLMSEPPANNTLLDARVHDAKHLLRLEGDYGLSFTLSCHDKDVEVLVLVHDHAGRISRGHQTLL